MTVRAGRSAAFRVFDARGGVGGDLDRLRGEPRVEDAQPGMQAAADAVQGEAAVGVGRRRLRPARPVVDAAPPEEWSFRVVSMDRPCASTVGGRVRQIAETETTAPGTGWPCTSKRRPSMTCSGMSRISADGWSSSGSSSAQPTP